MNNRRKLIEKMVICLLGMCCAVAWAAAEIVYPAICPGVLQPGACPNLTVTDPTAVAAPLAFCVPATVTPWDPFPTVPPVPIPPGCSADSNGYVTCWRNVAGSTTTVTCFECRRSLLCPFQGFEACVNITLTRWRQQAVYCLDNSVTVTQLVGTVVQNGAKCDCGDNPVPTPVDTPGDIPVDQ